MQPVPQPPPAWLDSDPRGIDAFVRTFAAAEPKNRAVRKLHALLVAMDPTAPLSERVHTLRKILGWVTAGGHLPGRNDDEPVARARLLVAVLDVASLAEPTVATLRAIVTASDAIGLFADMGLPGDQGLYAETVDRLSRRLLPEATDERDLEHIVAQLFTSAKEAAWLQRIPGDVALQLDRVLSKHGPAWEPIRGVMSDAIALLTTRISAIGLSAEIRERSPEAPLRSSPFFVLPRVFDSFLNVDTCRAVITQCRQVTAVVTGNLETAGVSVDVVYRLERIGKLLYRLEALLHQVMPDAALDEAGRAAAAARFFAALVHEKLKDRRLVDILRNNLHLLARKVIERAGKTGEHYITAGRREYRNMLLSAGGGGVLTAGTAALKFYVGWAKLPLLVEAIVASSNYAGSFLLMQLLGFTLATKQPSMTAAALAGALRGEAAKTELPTIVARITRSQLAAAIGNVGMVIPAAIGFDFAFRKAVGRPFLDPDTAHYVIHSLHPLETLTIFYAALTGVLLWVSSIGAGWIENWAVYRRLPDAIAHHRWRRIFGARFMGWLSSYFERSISGIGGNTSLGVLLGFVPILGKMTGLPIDVRHITLSTGALALAVSALAFPVVIDGATTEIEHAAPPVDLWNGVAWAGGGIAIIGMLNFGVSFVLALSVALRARNVTLKDGAELGLGVLRRFVRSPIQFFFPPKGEPEKSSGHAH